MTLSRRQWTLTGAGAVAAAALLVLSGAPAAAQSKEPIKIGFSMAMTGGLGPNGQSALLAQKIWEEDVNAKGGLLGRPVKLIYYDDQTNPSTIPGIYSKLLDVDKVDLIIGGYGTNMLAPAMPLVMQRKKMFIGLLGLGVNTEFNYPNYFVMIPSGPDPKPSFTKGFIDLALKQDPKPQTIAIVAADAEFALNAADGGRENAKKVGLKIVYDRRYPPATTDFAPIVRAIQAANPDFVVICSYPLDSVGMIRAINEIGYKPKMLGGAMVGIQATAIKMQLGPLMNGIVNYETWIPAKTIQYPGVMKVVEKYQARAQAEGVDPLGYYMPPWAYAYLQVVEQAVTETNSLDDAKLADYMRSATFKTVVGDIKFDKEGEWSETRMLTIQYQNIKSTDINEFKDMSKQPILAPANLKTGDVIFPYADAKK